ncbi:MAG: glycerate kinase [Anaerolineae bacterium]|nr:MAG: glycerate kinase [Anaerolineae bacterium]
MLTPAAFQTHTLRHHPQGDAIQRILAAAIQAVAPQSAVRRFVRREGETLWVADRPYDLTKIGEIRLLGLGKAALGMALPLLELLSDRAPHTLLIPKTFSEEQTRHLPPNVILQPGGHPVPNQNSLLAGQKARTFVSGLKENDLLICLISGGGSALMSAPRPGLTLDDLQQLTASLLACGARIDEINTLRRHLDELKGGGVARLAEPAQVVSLILSDVVGNLLETIASGPTAPDPSTRADALSVLHKYQLLETTPPAILHILQTAPETPKPGEPLFERVQNVIVGSNRLAAEAALAQAVREGFQPRFLGDTWQGEARQVAQQLCDHLAEEDLSPPFCLIAGGETTVTLRGSGRGGRNQELALAAVSSLSAQPGALLVTLATDGEDGPTDAAGAVVSPETLSRGLALGLDPASFLNNNDAYSYFSALGDLLLPGPTGTNVNDLIFIFKTS